MPHEQDTVISLSRKLNEAAPLTFSSTEPEMNMNIENAFHWLHVQQHNGGKMGNKLVPDKTIWNLTC